MTVKEDAMASVTLMNYINEEEYSEVDIDYVVEAKDTDKDEKSSLTVSPAAGTITKRAAKCGGNCGQWTEGRAYI